jgi:hypothetical protein
LDTGVQLLLGGKKITVKNRELLLASKNKNNKKRQLTEA